MQTINSIQVTANVHIIKRLYLTDMLLQVLTHKLVMLLALFTKQSVQTLHALSIDDIIFYDSCVIIPIRKLLKQPRKGNYKLSLN